MDVFRHLYQHACCSQTIHTFGMGSFVEMDPLFVLVSVDFCSCTLLAVAPASVSLSACGCWSGLALPLGCCVSAIVMVAAVGKGFVNFVTILHLLFVMKLT